MKLPVLLITVIVVLLLAGGGYFCFRQFFKQSPVKTLDQFPVMIINNGKTAVYQEVRISAEGIEKEIVVSSLGSDSGDTKIYEVIPKEVAEKASDLEFSVKPTIIEDDPIILWDLPSMHEQTPSRFTYKAPATLGISKSSSSKLKPYCMQKPEIVKAMKKLNYDPEDWDDCDFYVSTLYKAAVNKNKQIREEKEKDQVQIIQPGEAKYSEIQQKAKKEIAGQAKPTATPKADNSSKISAEEAIDIIKKDVQKNPRFDNITKFNLECKATYSQEDQGWRVICGRRNFEINKYMMNFHYEFYLVKDKKSWKQAGYYESVTDYNGYIFPTIGKPMWGVK